VARFTFGTVLICLRRYCVAWAGFGGKARYKALFGSIALVKAIIAQASYQIPSILQYITCLPSIERGKQTTEPVQLQKILTLPKPAAARHKTSK